MPRAARPQGRPPQRGQPGITGAAEGSRWVACPTALGRSDKWGLGPAPPAPPWPRPTHGTQNRRHDADSVSSEACDQAVKPGPLEPTALTPATEVGAEAQAHESVGVLTEGGGGGARCWFIKLQARDRAGEMRRGVGDVSSTGRFSHLDCSEVSSELD